MYCQEKKDLDIKIIPDQISGYNFDGKLSLSIENISKDTLYITLYPFYCVFKSDSINFYKVGEYGYFPNRIYFIKQNTKIEYLSASSNISFIKFPRIIYLFPGKKTVICFKLGEEEINQLMNIQWNVEKEIGYAYKYVVDTALKNNPEYLEWQLNQSLFYDETINIELGAGKSFNDKLLYFSKDGKNFDYDYESVYDSIIQRCFIQSVSY